MECRPVLTAVVAGVVLLVGCTHHQLNHSTVLTTSTVVDIQYQLVLRNLAKLSCQPEALPDHADLSDGVVQINDRLGFGQGGGFTSFTGDYGFGLSQFGPTGQRQVTEQWGADATTDPQRLTDLQDLYRVALGLPPLPPPNAIAYLRRQQSDEAENPPGDKGKRITNGSEAEEPANQEPSNESVPLPELLILPTNMALAAASAPSTSSSGGGGSTPSSGGGSSNGGSSRGDSQRRVPIEILLSDVPCPGWFHVGSKKDVPRDACYVGDWGGRYVWVAQDGIQDLSRFTVTVLNVVKLKPGEGGKKSGLAVTGGQ